MAKLCPRGKAAAKRKFKRAKQTAAICLNYVCFSSVSSGKVTPGGKKNKEKKKSC